MTRFTLYHTVTDTLGRVQGEIWALDDGLQQQSRNELKTDNTASTERVEMLTEKFKIAHAKRSQQRRDAKGGDDNRNISENDRRSS